MPTLSSLSQASTSYIFRPPSAFALTPATLLSVPWEAELPWRTTATHLLLLLRHPSPFFWVVSLLLPLGHQPLLHFLLYTFLSPKIIIFCRAPSLIVSANLLASLIPWSSLSIQSMAISQPSLFKTDTLSLSTTLRRLGSPDRLTVRLDHIHLRTFIHLSFLQSLAVPPWSRTHFLYHSSPILPPSQLAIAICVLSFLTLASIRILVALGSLSSILAHSQQKHPISSGEMPSHFAVLLTVELHSIIILTFPFSIFPFFLHYPTLHSFPVYPHSQKIFALLILPTTIIGSKQTAKQLISGSFKGQSMVKH